MNFYRLIIIAIVALSSLTIKAQTLTQDSIGALTDVHVVGVNFGSKGVDIKHIIPDFIDGFNDMKSPGKMTVNENSDCKGN